MLKLNSNSHFMDYQGQSYHEANVCSEFYGTKIIRHIDQTDACDELLITVNGYNKAISYNFSVNVTDITDIDKILSICIRNRLTLQHYMRHALSVYLMDEYRRCLSIPKAIEYRHKKLGWHTYNDKEYFLYDNTPIENCNSLSTRTNFKFQKGDKSTYLKFLNETVYTNENLSLGMAIGYSATVVSRIQDYFDTGAAIIVNLCGASSTGKTTIEQLMVSPYACPEISNKDGLIRTFHSTSNAVYAGISDIHGLPIVLDDITTNPNIDLANLIYTLTSGEQKGRCTTEGALRQDQSGWSGVIIISSETPIHEDSSQNQGLAVRVLQTQGITWTPDAHTAEYIKRMVKANYGFTGIEFANFVANIPIDTLCKQFEESQSKVHSIMLKRDALSDRLETKYSAIHLTIELMNQAFGIRLDALKLTRILLEPEQSQVEDRDIALKALDVIREFYTLNRNHFTTLVHDLNSSNSPSQAKSAEYGILQIKNTSCYLYITPQIVKEQLIKRGINEVTTVKQRWKDLNLTVCEKGRLDIKKLGVRYIKFIFDKGFPNAPIGEQNYNTANQLNTISPIPVNHNTIPDIHENYDVLDALAIPDEDDLGVC